MRARFLAGCGWGSEQSLLASLELRDRQLLEAFRDNRQVVLWFEHDLYDQLQLLDVLALAHTEEAVPELIVVGSFPGKPSFAGLGELTANELETLWPSRRPAEPAALEAAASSLGRAPGAGADDAGRMGDARDPAAAVPRRGAAAATRGAARAGRRPLRNGTACAPGDRGRRAHTSGRVRRSATTRSCAVPRRLLVLPNPLRARARDDRLLETEDGTPLPAPPPLGDSRLYARLQLRLTATGRNAPRRSRPSRAPRHRPLARRHPHHARKHLALGRQPN